MGSHRVGRLKCPSSSKNVPDSVKSAPLPSACSSGSPALHSSSPSSALLAETLLSLPLILPISLPSSHPSVSLVSPPPYVFPQLLLCPPPCRAMLFRHLIKVTVDLNSSSSASIIMRHRKPWGIQNRLLIYFTWFKNNSQESSLIATINRMLLGHPWEMFPTQHCLPPWLGAQRHQRSPPKLVRLLGFNLVN